MNNSRYRPEERILLLIDGECLLCHAVTRFVVRRDPYGRFRFAALQSDEGRLRLHQAGLPAMERDTFVMIDGGVCYTRSTAALRTLRKLGGFYRLCYLGIVVPVPIRDGIYRWVAKARYRWFGRSAVCIVPDARNRGRFMIGGEEL
ncbi:thiol-disulfide oxidoreductase DCC family protein [Paenibacillus sp. 1P07SE]|uniref:thiol-disulfide oxidoreductase DCC family protein n=1 Tax=Paenibacillus sp. 1P07SE TaxID=3132209 RepID=UPI0039A4209C